jgi:hypothetical protein
MTVGELKAAFAVGIAKTPGVVEVGYHHVFSRENKQLAEAQPANCVRSCGWPRKRKSVDEGGNTPKTETRMHTQVPIKKQRKRKCNNLLPKAAAAAHPQQLRVAQGVATVDPSVKTDFALRGPPINPIAVRGALPPKALSKQRSGELGRHKLQPQLASGALQATFGPSQTQTRSSVIAL